MGCGPAAEAVALMHVLRELLPVACPGTQPASITFEVTLVDAVAGWERSAVAAVREIETNDDTVRFVAGTWSDPAVKALAASADICLCSHVLADTHACKPGSAAAGRSEASETGAARNFLSDMIQAWKSQQADMPRRASDASASSQRQRCAVTPRQDACGVKLLLWVDKWNLLQPPSGAATVLPLPAECHSVHRLDASRGCSNTTCLGVLPIKKTLKAG